MLTYSEVGASLGQLPPGYHHLRERRQLGVGQARLDQVRHRLLNWDMQRGAGLVVPSAGPVRLGQSIEMRLPVAYLWLRIPVEVVAVVDEPDRAGFAYGTLVGHPESGEESFMVVRDSKDRVWAEIRAFSRAGRWWVGVAGPAARFAQRRMTERYLRALKS